MKSNSVSGQSVWNIPNALTVFRIFCVPVVVVFLLRSEYFVNGYFRWWALFVFSLAIFTDQLDGYVARRQGAVTDFGKIVDPIADKLLIGSCFVVLGFLGEIAWWIVLVILFREIAVTVLRFLVLDRVVLAASRGGKLKTVLQTLAVWLYLLPVSVFFVDFVSVSVLFLALLVTVVTGFVYFWQFMRLLRN